MLTLKCNSIVPRSTLTGSTRMSPVQSCLDLQCLWGWLIWQWSIGFEEKCTASESLWTCTELSLRESHGPTSVEQDSKSKSSSVFLLWHGDLRLNLLPAESPGPTVLQPWLGSNVASALLRLGLSWNISTANEKTTLKVHIFGSFLCSSPWSDFKCIVFIIMYLLFEYAFFFWLCF